MPTKDNHL